MLEFDDRVCSQDCFNLETNRAKAELEATALEIAFAYCFLISLQEKPIQSQAELEATAPVTAFGYVC